MPGSEAATCEVPACVSRRSPKVAPAVSPAGKAGAWPGLPSVPAWVSPRHPYSAYEGSMRVYTPADPGACVIACRMRGDLGDECCCCSFHAALSGTVVPSNS
jgi:hypothetical protein